jgi:MFS family permease
MPVPERISMSKRSSFYYGWVIVGIAALTMTLVYGVRHSFSVFFPSILNEFGWSRGSTSIMLSIHILAYGLLAPVAGSLGDRWRPRRIMPMGIIILGLAAASCSLANKLWHFYLIFGIGTPMGLAFCGWPLLSPALSNWFSTRRGLALGIGQVGGGFSFAYGVFAEFAISRFGWRIAYVIVGLTLIAVLVPLYLLFFYYRPDEKGLKPYGEDEPSEKPTSGPSSKRSNWAGWTVGEAMRTHQFWLLVVSQFFFWGVGCYLILAHQVKFAEDVGFSGIFAASIFALFGICMAAGQISSAVSDRIGREWTVVVSGILAVGSVFALVSVTDASKPWLLYVYAVGFGFGSGLYSPTIFAGAADIFHGPHFGAINGFILTGMGLGGVIGPWLGGYIYDITGTYRIAFSLSIIFFTLSCISFLLAAPRKADLIKQKRLARRSAG